MQHLDEGTIHAWLDGALPPDENMLIEQHAKECGDCAALVAEARGMIAGTSRIISALDVVPGGVIPKQPAPATKAKPASLWRSMRLTPLRAGLAATLMIAAASMFAVRRQAMSPAADTVALPRQVLDVPVAAAASSKPAPQPLEPTLPKGAAQPARRPQTAAPEASATAGAAAASPITGAVAPSPAARTAAAPPAANAARDEVARADAAKDKVAPAPLPPAPIADAKASGAVQSALDTARLARLRDTTLTLRGNAATAARSGFAQTSVSQSRLALEAVAGKSTMGSPLFEGCYRILPDSFPLLTLVPPRFALARDETPVARNTVRSLDPSGRMDTVLSSATWQPVNRDAAVVIWGSGRQREMLQLASTTAGITAEAVARGERQPVRIVKVACPQ